MKKKLFNYNDLFNYYLIRSKNRIKTITARFVDNSIYIYTPLMINMSLIEKFLEKNKEQMMNYLKNCIDENKFLYLGEKYEVIVVESKLLIKHVCSINEQDKVLYVYKSRGNFDLKEVLNQWKKEVLLELIQDRVEYFISKYKFNFDPKINHISVKKMSSKWGSCSIQHNLNFNLNLIEKRMDIIDYVIVHELTHTINFNHSKDFWNNVNKVIPNYIKLRQELKNK